MRLLQLRENGEYQLTKDLVGDEVIPAYAILSHTWGPDTDEVSYEDITKNLGKQKPGFEKLRFCAEQARTDDLHFFWIDTCCINKGSDAELSEAINSMFRWYHNAAKCYVYLSDVNTEDTEPHDSSWMATFKRSRWHTRGWTLQELIAPRSVEFFSSAGIRLGDKGSLENELHEITGVPKSILQGGLLSDNEVEKRLSWMDHRRTKREEDQAYALLGLFEVHMPLIYGEGKRNALRRLNEEIAKSTGVKQHEAENDASSLQPQAGYFEQLPWILRHRTQLHSSTIGSEPTSHWEVLDEENLPDTINIKIAKRPTDRWISGAYKMSYPATNPVAEIIVSVDWHAFEGDPSNPRLKWRIHTPQSLYHPGTHIGRVTFTNCRDIFTPRCIKVLFDSPIFSPFVHQGNKNTTGGFTSSEGELEEMMPTYYRLDHILQSVAHFLAYGPYYDGPEAAPFRFHRLESRAYSDDRDAFARASSFWARAYTMPIPDEQDFLDMGLSDGCRETTATVIRELVERYKIPVDETWDFETSLKTVTTQRGWALEEGKWADKLRAIIFGNGW